MCDAKPTVGIEASAASSFIAVTMPSGSVRGLLRSSTTRLGGAFLISASADSSDLAKTTRTPSCCAAVLILDENIKSSSTATIMVFMILETQAVGPFFKNGFVVGCETTRAPVLTDPGDEVKALLSFAERNTLTIRHILLTHAHVDHVTGVAAAKRALGVPVHLHRDDLFIYERAVESGAQFGLHVAPQTPIDVFFAAGEVIAFGGYEVRPYHTPGHCPGGVCLQIGRGGGGGEGVFVGDNLVAGPIGRKGRAGGRM